MKTLKEFLELLAESDSIRYHSIDLEQERYESSSKSLIPYILDECLDGANVLDYLALAIDQMGKKDGINLIEEVWQKLEDGEDTPTEEDLDDEKPLSGP